MMPKPVRFASRVVLLVAIVTPLWMLVAPSTATPTPYLSALSNLVASPAFAGGCTDKACCRGIESFSSPGFKCIRFNGKGCTATACG